MAAAPEEKNAMFRLIAPALRPKELSGSFDLIPQLGLQIYHDAYSKHTLAASIAQTHYLQNIVGDTELRKGEGMELMQCIHNLRMRDRISQIKPFDLEVLRQAFELRESGPIKLSEADKGIQTISGKVRHHEHRDKDKKHKHHKDKDKDKDRDKDREHKKHKHRHKDKDKEKRKDKGGNHENGDDKSKKHHKKKRKHDGGQEDGDSHKHKKRKHKDSKADDGGHMKNGN